MKKTLLCFAAISLAASGFAQNVITEAPDGIAKLYNKNCIGTYTTLGTTEYYKDNNVATSIVWTEGEEAYLYNILNLAEYNTYVKGLVNGNVITVQLPQTVYYDSSEGTDVLLMGVKAEDYIDDWGREGVRYIADPSIRYVTYTIAEDGTLNLVCPGEPFDGEYLPDYGIGYVYSNSLKWTGYCDFVQELTPMDGNIVEMPEGVETAEYSLIYDDYGNKATVAIEGDKMFIKGLNPNVPDGVFYARIEDGYAYVPQNQIIGIFSNCFIYTKCVYPNPDYDYEDEYSPEVIFAPEDAEYCFKVENDGKILRSAENNGMLFALNGSLDRVYTLCIYEDFTLQFQDSYAGIPENPRDLYWYDEFADRGFSSFFFSISNISDGNLLENDDMYYIIYVNGKAEIFQESENTTGHLSMKYRGLNKPTIRIPYMFTNWGDINVFTDTSRRLVCLYRNDVETIGVQAIYEYEGSTTFSDIVTLNLLTNRVSTAPGNNPPENPSDSEGSINKLDSDHNGLYKVYNLQGIKLMEAKDKSALNSLPAGLYIVNGKKVYL